MNRTVRTPLLVIVAVLSAALALGATTGAVAGTLITSKMIKDDTIQPRDLNFVTGVEGDQLENPVEVGTDQSVALETTMTVDDAGGLAVAQADLLMVNTTDSPIEVTVELVHKQDPKHHAIYTNTVPAFGKWNPAAGFQCDLLPAGNQTAQVLVQASAAGVTIETGEMTMIAGPHL